LGRNANSLATIPGVYIKILASQDKFNVYGRGESRFDRDFDSRAIIGNFNNAPPIYYKTVYVYD
jgi:hypothetical protein